MFEEVLQSEFSDEADGTAVDGTLEVFVFHQRFANLADVDMRVFHAPDLTALERLEGEVRFRWWVRHGRQFSRRRFRREENRQGNGRRS